LISAVVRQVVPDTRPWNRKERYSFKA